jgi:hypothetical protein
MRIAAFVLLLLDFWPLGRAADLKALEPVRKVPTAGTRLATRASRLLGFSRIPGLDWRGILLEKVPFFVLAVASSIVTFLVQRKGGAVITAANLPLPLRLENAPVSYCRYLCDLFYPRHLSVFYPHPIHWPGVTVCLSALVLAALSAYAVTQRKHRPYLLMGWVWFLGTTIPVIGLVQVGQQSIADRYTYLPLIGPSIRSLPETAARFPERPPGPGNGSGAAGRPGRSSAPPDAGARFASGLVASPEPVAGALGPQNALSFRNRPTSNKCQPISPSNIKKSTN